MATVQPVHAQQKDSLVDLLGGFSVPGIAPQKKDGDDKDKEVFKMPGKHHVKFSSGLACCFCRH